MAGNTPINLRKQMIYSIYVRNHSELGNFKGVIKDLDRIKDLGTDIIWLLPIHPIGQVNKKGTLGCPYSISDYRNINPEYGTINDFKELIEETHNRNMKLIIDVVYNHTSHGSYLWEKHPEWFYKKSNGEPGNKVGDWTDIIDLDYSNKELWIYQIETLKYWASQGVDGFRCDVAPLVPIEFWKQAREEVSKVKEGVLWLSETIDSYFLKYLRDNKVLAHSDCEIYEAFDMTYDYDTYKYFVEYLKGERTLEEYLEKKRIQELIYPANYVKLRFLENHDNLRAANLIRDNIDLEMWTAFVIFEKGISLIYAGQEFRNTNTPSLFDRDLISYKEHNEFTLYLKNLIQLKKCDIFSEGNYDILKCKKNGVIEVRYSYNGKSLAGIFNVERKTGEYPIDLIDGSYKNLANGVELQVENGQFKLPLYPVIIEI